MYLLSSCYNVSRKEKIEFCQCLAEIKVPSGYSSNIQSFVSMKEFKLVGLKSHHCYALMQQLLPVAIRSILLKYVHYVIIQLCFFFNAVCSRELTLKNWMSCRKILWLRCVSLRYIFHLHFLILWCI